MSVDTGRFARIVALIASVSAVFLLTTAETFGADSRVFSTAVVAIGSISLVTAITGFLISASEMVEE
jgi:hypothetical protein